MALFETRANAAIREGFAAATTRNEQAIAEFNPDSKAAPYTSLEISSGFDDYEAADPQLTAQHQQTMLRRLGIPGGTLEPDDPNLLHQSQFAEGLRQVHRVQRADGDTVIVSSLTQDDNTISQLRLLTWDRADEDIAWYEEVQENHRLTEQLIQHLSQPDNGQDSDQLRQNLSNLSLEEKQEMLDQLATLKKLEVTEGGEPLTKEEYEKQIALGNLLLQAEKGLAYHRKRYVKTILPITGIFEADERHVDKAQQRTDAYEEAIKDLLSLYEPAPEWEADKFIHQEQARRLALFNRQLRLRTRIKAVGATAIGGILGGGATLAGIGVGEFGIFGASHTEGIIGGIVVGAGLVAKHARTVIRRLRMVAPFAPDTTAPEESEVAEQITAEIKLARLNKHNINNMDVD